MQKLKPQDKLEIINGEIHYDFEVSEDGGFVVLVPELPGCVSEGETFEHAWEMIQDALEGWLGVAAKHGDPIPDKFRGLISAETDNRDG